MEIFAPILDAINQKKLSQPAEKSRWVEVSDRISVHAKGIRPAFRSPRKSKGGYIQPASFDGRYKYLFDDYILNRHPNEAEEHYNWRLSTFPLIAQEIYLNAKGQILGAIFQTSQYTLESNEQADNDYLDSIEFDKWFTNLLPEFIFTDPFGLIAVVEGHNAEFSQNVKATPIIEMVESRFIMAYEKNESLIFQASERLNGKRVIYYLDRNWSVKLIETSKKDEYEYLSGYQHGMGVLPVVKNEEAFFQSFVSWADMLGRNISDDEVIAKNASYPIREITAPKCPTCQGSCKITKACEPTENNGYSGIESIDCSECGGKGTISINPGDTLYTVEKNNDIGPQRDRVKYYNPDISINDFSFKRWQKIYEFGMRSMHMKHTEEAQSGTAKAIDREQLYFLISNVKNKLFEIGRDTLKLLISYLRTTTPAKVTGINEDAPQQFQIKTEYDIQEEYTDLVSKGASLMVRRAKVDEYMYKAFNGNSVALRKYEIQKRWDFLYEMTDTELQSRLLLGSAKASDFVKHDRFDTLIDGLIQANTPEWLIKTDINTVLRALDAAVAPYLPSEGVTMPA